MLVKNGNYLLNIRQTRFTRVATRYCDTDKLEPEYPELIDVLFTQNCDYGCDFCYLDCTSKGRHADLDFAEQALESVPDWVEINCAGGNIIRHPQWREIPKKFKRFRSLNTTVNPKVFDEIDYTELDGFTAVGVSVNDSRVFKKYEYPITGLANCCYAAIQMIPEMIGVNETKRILELAAPYKMPVLFLGYKSVGRGRDNSAHYFSQTEFEDITNLVKEREIVLSADTAFIGRYYHLLRETLSENLPDLQEGKFSFYIDLVHKFCARSSWSLEKEFPLSDVKTMFNEVKL